MIYLHHYNRGTPLYTADFPGGSVVKNPLASVGDAGDTRDVSSISGLGRFPGEGNDNPLQFSCLEIPWTEVTSGPQSNELQKSQTTE